MPSPQDNVPLPRLTSDETDIESRRTQPDSSHVYGVEERVWWRRSSLEKNESRENKKNVGPSHRRRVSASVKRRVQSVCKILEKTAETQGKVDRGVKSKLTCGGFSLDY